MTDERNDGDRSPWGMVALFTAIALIVGLTGGYIASETVGNDETVASGAAPDTAPTTAAPVDDTSPDLEPVADTAPSMPMDGDHHHEEPEAEPIMDAATQALFSEQMATARQITAQYPTVADAEAAGLTRVGPYAANSGAHYLVGDPQGSLGFDVNSPIIHLYAGNEPTSPVVGLMYYSFGDEPPEGFAGTNDHWHEHTGLCLGYGEGTIELPLPIDKDATLEQCDAVGGRFMESTGWMVHVWSAAGWESPDGVFSHDNTLLVCTDGTPSDEVTLHEGCPGFPGV